jgi:hypothetical protein
MRQARNQCEGSACYLLYAAFLLGFNPSTLKMEATCSSETSVDFQLTTLRYITKDKTSYLPLWEFQILQMWYDVLCVYDIIL